MKIPEYVYGMVRGTARCYHIIHTFNNIDRATKSGAQGGMTQCGTNNRSNPVDLRLTRDVPNHVPACQRCTKEAWKQPQKEKNVSRLSDLTQQYEAAVMKAESLRNSIKSLLGVDKPMFFGPIATTGTSSTITFNTPLPDIRGRNGKYGQRTTVLRDCIKKYFSTKIFTAHDLAEKIKMSKDDFNAAHQALCQIAKRGEITRVARGQYVLGNKKKPTATKKRSTITPGSLKHKILSLINSRPNQDFTSNSVGSALSLTMLQASSVLSALATERRIRRKHTGARSNAFSYYAPGRFLPYNKKTKIVGTPLDNPVGV